MIKPCKKYFFIHKVSFLCQNLPSFFWIYLFTRSCLICILSQPGTCVNDKNWRIWRRKAKPKRATMRPLWSWASHFETTVSSWLLLDHLTANMVPNWKIRTVYFAFTRTRKNNLPSSLFTRLRQLFHVIWYEYSPRMNRKSSCKNLEVNKYARKKQFDQKKWKSKKLVVSVKKLLSQCWRSSKTEALTPRSSEFLVSLQPCILQGLPGTTWEWFQWSRIEEFSSRQDFRQNWFAGKNKFLPSFYGRTAKYYFYGNSWIIFFQNFLCMLPCSM